LENKYEPVLIDNGYDAWSWLFQGNHCDLIISDLKMPSLDGFELLENLNNNGWFSKIPVIILSGFDEDKDKCMESGAYAYIGKPFEPQKLISEIKRALSVSPELC
jgi:two-component system chemotaxis response regulator CheY